jgi:hypothetical protein
MYRGEALHEGISPRELKALRLVELDVTGKTRDGTASLP